MINQNYTIPEEQIYIPTNLINQNYQYRFNGENITIVTNNNCYNNYNTTYCDCYTYNYKNNITTNSYQCSTNASNTTQIIPYTKITDDPNYSEMIRNNYMQENLIYAGIFIIGIVFAILLTKERSRL